MTKHLSENDIDSLIEFASKVPDEVLDGANEYLKPYGRILDNRIRKFRLDKIS